MDSNIVNDFSIDVTTTKNVNRKLSNEIAFKAARLIAPDADSSAHDAIAKYAKERFSINGCCTLYSVSKTFYELCKKLGVDIGEKEVVVTSKKGILYTSSYHSNALMPIDYLNK